jgi:hypothetical protein
MYHGYKNKGGGYWKGRSRFGKNYASQFPPMKYWGTNARGGKSSNKYSGVESFVFFVLIVVIIVLTFIILR